jgi:signal transduction histidine kinase
LLISPCFFDEKLLASIIIGGKENYFSQFDADNSEQFAALLSFTISNNKTRELNTTLENRLLQAQKLETIGKLSSGMAHDFSNLLSSIFGSINLLKKRISDKEDTYRLLDNIENCSIRARDLTRGLLSFGKPTPKRRELIKPNSLFSEISKVITQTFPAKIIFESHIEKNLYDILGNGTEVYQVLLNLCVNAKEAIADKGKITLTAENISINDSNIGDHPLLEKGNYIWFSVKDTGSGIKEEDIIKIFDPYFTTKDKQNVSGSGLGLYVTYGIIKAHNGHIEVSSILNQGTTFDVFIPAFEPKAEDKKVSADKIVLLADDETMLRDLLAELLESYGYNVIKVSSGNEALKVLTEEIKVDLAIIDYNMPEMDGLKCIENIRALKFQMPIILSSGSIKFENNFDYKKAGITAILSKPYEFETMLSTIQKLI